MVIPSGIDTERFAPLPPADYKARLGLAPDRVVVGIVTRMRVRKGVEEFLRAMAMVRERLPAACAVVVGEVELGWGAGSDLVARARARRPPASARAAAATCRRCCRPSTCSSSRRTTRACRTRSSRRWRCSKPVVATDVGGTGEVVQSGSTGLLVPPKDPAALADGDRRSVLSASAETRAAMGARGRAGGRRALLGARDGAADGSALHAPAAGARRSASRPVRRSRRRT